MITGSLLPFGVTMLAGHFGFSWAVPFILRGLGVARTVANVAGAGAKPTAPRPDATVGQIVVTDPREVEYLKKLLADAAAAKSQQLP